MVREGAPLRKISISQGVNSPGGYGLNSPSTTRPGARRRETQDAYPFPANTIASPSIGRAASPPPALTRRRTDFKDAGPGSKAEDSEAEEAADTSRTPFGTLKRTATAGPMSAGIGGPSSPWASTPQATSAGFSPMGAFGNFAIGSNAATAGTPVDKRPGLGAGRAESRFKGLMSKDGDDPGRGLREQQNIGRLQDDEADEEAPSGSAALGGGQDISPPRTRAGLGTPSRQDSRDDFGFAAFGMTSDAPSFRNLMHQQEQFHQTPQSRGPQQQGANEPLSPSDTNPYQSPEQHGIEPDDVDADGSELHTAHLPGLGGFLNEGMTGMTGIPGIGGFAGMPNLQVGRGPGAPPSDRSQTSSVGAHRGFSGLSGLGALPGLGGASAWGGAQGNIGTPTRERAGLTTNFGDNVFGSTAETQSPNLAGLGHSNFFGGHGNATGVGRGGSRLGSLFPQAMQEQMRAEQGRQRQEGEGSDGGEYNDQAGPVRDTDSPLRANRGAGDLPGGFSEQSRNALGQFGSTTQTPSVTSASQEPIGQRPAQPSAPMQPVSSSASNQPPAAQQKTMVMPDRMRWIYRDPQGVTQGPWSGLEMHDWYKAGFFSPELLVKKYEDPDYEPLAQLIRRIGNSREPFLVPQIGIPHGPSTTQPSTGWSGPVPAPASGAQPPFASSFPSFGTTLTADQQNALERRKQEEQYLMARQKEHLAQQQIAQRYSLGGQHGILPQQLHHHSSAHSLHSQPSFGSITSPNTAFQPSPLPGPSSGSQNVPGFFDNSFRSGAVAGLGAVGAGVDMLGNIREEEMPSMLDRMSLGRQAQGQFGGIGQPIGQNDQHAQQVASMLDDRARLQQEQTQHDASQRFQQDQAGPNERFQQFQGLQDQARSDPFGIAPEGVIGKPKGAAAEQHYAQSDYDDDASTQDEEEAVPTTETSPQAVRQGSLSLTEQVQKAAYSQQSPAPQSAWGKIDTALPQPFPPAPSQSPLPAPAAQRSRPSVADALHAESRSRSQTPSTDTPSASIAPWAKEPAEAPRGPSLREIQEAEAKVAAEAEAIAAEARRAAFEKELLAQAQSVAPAPGLPSSSTWASSNTAAPITPVASAPSPWVKAAKAPTATPAAKSMAQIQKEEEARKKRVIASAAAASLQQAAVSGAALQAAGKRYADLAGKVASPVAGGPGIGGAWTTVGASGKVKTPVPPPAAVPAPTTARVASVSALPTVAVAAKKPLPVKTAGGATVDAKEEFKKWAVNELKHDLNKGVPGKHRNTEFRKCSC